MFELLRHAKDFQSLIVGVIGFGSVILTLNRNAAIARNQERQQNAHDAQVLRRALRAELTIVRGSLQFNIETIDKVQGSVAGVYVPTRPMVHIYHELLAKIGLLSENEIGVVMEAYALIAQLNERTALLAAHVGHQSPAAADGFFFVPREALQHVRALESGYLEKVDLAIAAIGRAALETGFLFKALEAKPLPVSELDGARVGGFMTVELEMVPEQHRIERAAPIIKALTDITGVEPPIQKRPGVAGPNDFLHILFVPGIWELLAGYLAVRLGGRFLDGLASESGKLAARRVWRQKSEYEEAVKTKGAEPLVELVRQIAAFKKSAPRKREVMSFAVPVPPLHRSPGMPVTSEDPAEVIFQLATIARLAPEIRDAVLRAMQDPKAVDALPRNPDRSFRIEVLEDGTVRIGDIIIRGPEGEE